MQKKTTKPTKRRRPAKAAKPAIAVRRGLRYRSRPLQGGHARYIVIAGVAAHQTAQGMQPRVTWFETTRSGRRLPPATRLVDGKRVRRAPDGVTFLTYDPGRAQWIMPCRYEEVTR